MNHNWCNRRIYCFAVLAAVISLAVGCKAPWSSDWKFTDMFRLDKGMPWHEDGPEIGIPTRLVGTWTDTVLHQSGKTPQRGFGGRLIFYGKESNEPIVVDGQVVIYAFDEANRESTDNRPTRRYVFPADQVALHMSESDLGPTYSFWLPWDEVGGRQTEVSLIARFEPKGGAVVVGEQTKHLLPGSLAPANQLARHAPPKLPDGIPMRPAIEPVSYSSDRRGAMTDLPQQAIYHGNEASSDGTLPAQTRRMTTTSISLPENFRLRGGAPPARATHTPNDVPPVRAAAQPAASPQNIGGGGAPARAPQASSPVVTPLTEPMQFGGGANAAPPVAPTMPPHAQLPPAGEMATTVSYLSAAESARWAGLRQSSAGYQPVTLPVPATPISR
jgi:hypothetical protein